MRLVTTTRFWRDYNKLNPTIQNQVDKALELLAENPHHPSLHTHKRRGEKEVWQARVTRGHRLYFEMEGDIIRLVSVVSHEK